MIPQTSGTPAVAPAIPNLIRRSVQSDPIAAPGVGSRASVLSSAPSPSPSPVIAKKGEITLARWNKHYLIPRLNSGGTSPDTNPVTSFAAPDWVLVTTNGPKAFTAWDITLRDTTNVNFAVGRYAYAIYDEGGLVDINGAGYPSPTPSGYPSPTPSPVPSTYVQSIGRKSSIAFADLTALGMSTSSLGDVVGWRNYASVQPAGTFTSFIFDPNAADRYVSFVLSNTGGFMTVDGTATWNGRTNQAFLNRQTLLQFRSSSGFSQDALQYLGTFSREAEANTPQWKPAAPDATNPDFRTLKVTAAFPRNDGTAAKAGEALLKKRFLLQRLNWLTYKGPSAGRTLSDPDIQQLTVNGISPAFLAQGTDGNIANYFGLQWDTTNERWNYIGHSGTPSLASSIATLGTLTGSREPDFFELLQAGILNSSLGDSVASDPALPIVHQQSKMLHLLTIGANLIGQARTDSYPIRIAFSNGGTTMEAVSSPRLPYINCLAACPVGTSGTAGGIHWFLVPNLWDPFRDNWDLTETSSLTPQYPRPAVRITVSGSIGFGSASAAQSGSVPSASATPFPAGSITVASQSVTLLTGDKTNGRDGIADAARVGSSDITTAVPSFVPTTSPTSPFAEWDSVPKVSGSLRYVVFRLSLAGSNIPSSAIGANPVLILQNQFQITMDYQSPTNAAKWYPYSYLQGNNAPSTWISGSLCLTTNYSQYGLNPAPSPSPPASSPTILTSSAATPWAVTTLANTPMLAKADPRSIRYNSEIGALTFSGASPSPSPAAGIAGSIWPNGYATPPPMPPGVNPANYSQTIGDNGPSGTNPYNESISAAASVRPIVMNRPFRSVGEMSYAFRDQPFKTVDFFSASSPDAALLDLFSVNDYKDASGTRAGVINLNTRQPLSLAAIVKNTIRREETTRTMDTGSPPAPSPAPSLLTAATATSVGTSLVSLTGTTPVLNKAELTRLIASETGMGPTVQKTQREAIARALGESDQTRTWNLMIDVIAQSGRYPPVATSLSDFVVEGEKRYWLHIAIDRFTGEVIDQQLEAVYE